MASDNDRCVACGADMVEGYGMVCEDCGAQTKEAAREEEEGGVNVSDFSKIETIYEYTNKDFDVTNGAYLVTFKGTERLFIRNGNSVGTVSHFLGRYASQCVSEIRDDVKYEFLAQLALQSIRRNCAGCDNWSGSDCTLFAPDTGCPHV